MVNLAVPYSRGNYALQTLVAEVKARWGNPARWPEYVTGYKSVSNVTGHNADNNGVCHAVDLFFSNNSAWSEARGWELAEWLRTVEGPKGSIPGYPDRMYYIIYRDRIAGDFSNWQWMGSGYAHWDHIHVSTVDLYWGDPVTLPAGDYDSKAPWGFGSGSTLTPASNTTPITTVPLEDDMSAADVAAIRGDLNTVHAAVGAAERRMRADLATVHTTIIADVGGQLAGLREALAQSVRGTGSPIDMVAVEAAAKRGSEAALATMKITVEGGGA